MSYRDRDNGYDDSGSDDGDNYGGRDDGNYDSGSDDGDYRGQGAYQQDDQDYEIIHSNVPIRRAGGYQQDNYAPNNDAYLERSSYQQGRGSQQDDNYDSGSEDGDYARDRGAQRGASSYSQSRSRDAPSGQYDVTEPGELPPGPDESGERPYPGDYIVPSGNTPTRYDSNQAWDANVGPAHIQSQTAARVQPPTSEYSQMTGKRRAVLVGINYLNSEEELHGCENDVQNMKRYLTESCGYRSSDIWVLTEDEDPESHPTRDNMISAMQWLTKGAQRHDALFFHYSGHGGRRPGGSGIYTDQIYPCDHAQNGTLRATKLYDLLVKPLPAGCRLTTIFDACHSASALGLPFSYNHTGSYDSGVSSRASAADVIEFSGCQDDQTSADATEDNQPQGAMTWAFLTALHKSPRITYRQLLVSIREVLRDQVNDDGTPKYPQIPQLSSSHRMETNLLFVM
ncbi:Metacaspase [Mycena sanguinolenta]|uniref:Metacaspase n=1 Tax=Mycena sanguinolenta TaxID=230812 RepID=A0A8H7CM06_9AGAR|nr:Metacaspase [Mycena sanguinolenta]